MTKREMLEQIVNEKHCHDFGCSECPMNAFCTTMNIYHGGPGIKQEDLVRGAKLQLEMMPL